MHDYQKTNEYFAQIAPGLEEDGAKEFKWYGAKATTTILSGIYFTADKESLYRINYKSRLATRILAPLTSFECFSSDGIYNAGKQIDWDDFISVSDTFAVFANVSDSNVDNSHFAALRLKDAIADWFVDKYGKRPSIDTKNPAIWFNLHLRKNQAVISVDTSCGSLHKRGYRKNAVSAPMQETLAAAVIQATEWDGEQPFYDIMCGSGTLLCEAIMYCSNIPAGNLRKRFGFEKLPDFDQAIWINEVTKSRKKIRPLAPDLIHGNDISDEAIRISKTNVNSLPFGNRVKLTKNSFEDLVIKKESIIVCNPPYGIRMKGNIEELYKKIGDFLKQKCSGSSAFIYFGDRKLVKHIGLKATWKKNLKNGGLDGQLVKYEMY
jgi:putative N6-adenine-specific DNA methylase